MQLLRMTDVPISDRDRVFRLSPARPVALAAILAAVACGLAWHAWSTGENFFYYLAGVIVVALMFIRRPMLARFRPTNWLARVVDLGVYVHFRSHLNHHLPADDLTVVFIGLGEIRCARKIRERREMVHGDADGPFPRQRVTEQRRWLVELELSGDTESLRSALAANLTQRAPKERAWFGSTSMLFQHYPARLASPDRLEIEWRAAGGPDPFLEALLPHVRIDAPAKVVKNLSDLEGLSQEQQQARLLELVETGQKLAAISMARRVHGYDLARAKSFVEELAETKRAA